MYEFVFYIFAAICIVSGSIVAVSRNIAYAAFALLFTFFGVAGIYVMLGADFVGVSQLLIYVGGILVLFLFGMMLTSNIDRLKEEPLPFAQTIPKVIVATAIGAVLILMVWSNPIWRKATPKEIPQGQNTTSIIGQLFI